ncbi:aspartyl-phosphate phosphatase Spo0E family protein [Neobacillus sp. PS3-40]|uniref:aspartyl-phosphate phosphatase Spo0E family protein n=1 Tax=Neobacillus sp. PS3-40 TaxID=3070679 RepID=UPI0027DF3804|nr:aspartyl-phosphate phosphatase Spo0E family protein [Neobacillus sp. PS3-40]WML43498.1 aspartyl-phosphate phosphatase Spo0E family protein [Neobacillus sp. PS3-40]
MCKYVKSHDEIMLEEIRAKRKNMIDCANICGISSEETIRFSQELDKLIFTYQCRPFEEKRMTLIKCS